MKTLTIHHIPGSDNAVPRVRVSYRKAPSAQAQERETEFRFSISDEQRDLIQWYLEEFLIYPWGEWLNRAAKAENLMIQLGLELFEAVFGARETCALYAHVADDLPNTRVIIHASDPSGISIPWELMRDPSKAEYGDLARLAHAFVRSQPDLIFEPPTVENQGTLNILMVICRPGGPDGDFAFQSVARPLLELFRKHQGRIRMEVLRPPTFEQLARLLTEKPNFYQVLHFDGHGAFPEGASEQGCLLFEGEDGNRREVAGEELGGLVAGKSVPIVLLDACQSGMTRPESVYPSVGNQLLRSGTSGVVAMTHSVYVQTAVRFMARLYQGLVNGEELARAVTFARDELRSHPQRTSPIGDVNLRDWMVPVLFEARPVQVLEPRTGLHLDTSILEDQQASSGQEIDCPKPPTYGFVGRDGVILELERAFRNETAVLFRGMAGVGKTETAVGFGRWLAETGGLQGPVFFSSFEHYKPLAHVCDRVGQEFNQSIRQQLGTDWHLLNAEQRRQVALGVLKQIPFLLVWDNFETVRGFPEGTESAWSKDEQEELLTFLSHLHGGVTKVLITSRCDEKWLAEAVRCVDLGGLKLIEAQELALKVLTKAGLNASQIRRLPQYNDLLEYLRGNPLAIQIILPELKRIEPDVLLERLRSGEVTFAAEDPKEGRDKSLTASLTYRLDSLDQTLRKRLGILALFQGFVDADVLKVMCDEEDVPDLLQGLESDDWKGVLDSATQVGLVRRVGEGLYTVHPALPWFFRDLLDQAFPGQREWFERAYASAYGGYGSYLDDLFHQSPQLAMSLLGAEEDNLMHALRLARASQRWDQVHSILYGFMRLFTIQGRWVDWERLIEIVERGIVDANGEPLSGREDLFHALLGHRAMILDYRRNLDGAKRIYLRLKDHFVRKGDDRNVAVCLHQLGMIAQERRQFDEAENWYRKSLAIKERIGDERGQASTQHQLGIIAEERRNFEEAANWYRQSLAIEERIGDEDSQASTMHQLGTIAEEGRQYDEAESWYRKSLAIKERIGNERGQAITLHQLGIIAQKREHFDEAESWCRQSLAIEERIGNERGQASTQHQLGIIAQKREHFDEAESFYRESLAINERIGNEHGQASTLHQLGIISEERGDKLGAISLYEQAEAIFVTSNNPYSLEIVRESLERVRQK